MRKRTKGCLAAASFAAILVVAMPLVLIRVLSEPWIEPVPDVDMTPAWPAMAPDAFGDDSAFRLLERAGEMSPELNSIPWHDAWTKLSRLPFPEAGAAVPEREGEGFAADLPWSAREMADVDRVLQLAEPNLVFARRAAREPDGRMPYPRPDALEFLSSTRTVARLLCLSAHRLASLGRRADALAEMETGLRCGAILSRGGPLIARLVDSAISGVFVTETWRLLPPDDAPDPALEQALADRLAILEGEQPPYAETLRVEAAVMADRAKSGAGLLGSGPALAFNAVAARLGILPGGHPDDMLNDLVLTYAHLVRLAESPYDAVKTREFAVRFDPSPGRGPRRRRDPVGFVLAGQLVPVALRGQEEAIRQTARLRGLRVLLALRLHRERTGEFPRSLAEVAGVPGSGLPTDPFSGERFRYSRDADGSILLYSVGPDGVDDGGDTGGFFDATRPAGPDGRTTIPYRDLGIRTPGR